MDKIMKSKDYPVRRGAAYGLGGIVCGMGLKSMREMSILTTLKEQCSGNESATADKREGCMMAFECLIKKL